MESSIRRRRRNRAGFTLTEMLVVIAIIATLAALITVAAMNALGGTKDTAIKAEVNQLNDAFTNFKNKYGAYPPCDLSFPGGHPASNPALLAFIMQAFPRYNTGGSPNYSNLVSDWTNLGIDQTTAHPDRAIVFWLSGFSPDVTQPFTGAGSRTPFYQFDQTRLTVAATSATAWTSSPGYTATNPNFGYTTQYQIGQYAYVPQYGTSPNAPYAYIDAGHYGTLGASPQISLSASNSQPYTIYDSTSTSHGIAAAYVQDLQNVGSYNGGNPAAYQFCNPTTFQILSAGQDGQFGIPSQSSAFPNGRLYYTGYGYSIDGSDLDNVTNFCSKATLGNSIP